MKFDQKRIDEAKAYLSGESKTPPPWLPENTQLREGKLYIGEKEVIPYEQRNEVLARMYADPKLTGGRDRLFEHVKEKYVGISRRDIMQYFRNNETHQTHAPLPRRETTRRIVAGGPNKIAQADLIDMGDLAGHNGAKRYSRFRYPQASCIKMKRRRKDGVDDRQTPTNSRSVPPRGGKVQAIQNGETKPQSKRVKKGNCQGGRRVGQKLRNQSRLVR
jgi:hypothetical protein